MSAVRPKPRSPRLATAWQSVRSWLYRLQSTNRPTGRPVLNQPLLALGDGRIEFGNNVQLGVRHSPGYFNGHAYIEARFVEGSIRIGDNVRINNEVVLIATVRSIEIGADCLFGYRCEILDSDFHGLPADKRGGMYALNGDVRIGRNVWLGNHVKILKGVTIGDNTVVANGSIVTRSLPANVIAGGIPCRVIGPLEADPDRVFVHAQGINESANVGARTRIWAYAHVLPGARIGADCNICDHTFIENDVVIGDRVTVKSGVSLWDGLRIEDDVFIGPSAAFTNDRFPRSKQYPDQFPVTTLRRGASIGANATILPGLTIGEYAMIGAGAVVTRDVPAGAVVVGNPGRILRQIDSQETPP